MIKMQFYSIMKRNGGFKSMRNTFRHFLVLDIYCSLNSSMFFESATFCISILAIEWFVEADFATRKKC